ncbi:hypothetical protein QVD17_05523 [Tagetes erecta]|uniref:Uncharacterized protein n=1 Tax=Tagetes erecta TaxID=13708 RepID=A0AAD8LHM8_TARER|nr:hypothetical protein QVD17_05523 [Tagetes erecta]
MLNINKTQEKERNNNHNQCQYIYTTQTNTDAYILKETSDRVPSSPLQISRSSLNPPFSSPLLLHPTSRMLSLPRFLFQEPVSPCVFLFSQVLF